MFKHLVNVIVILAIVSCSNPSGHSKGKKKESELQTKREHFLSNLIRPYGDELNKLALLAKNFKEYKESVESYQFESIKDLYELNQKFLLENQDDVKFLKSKSAYFNNTAFIYEAKLKSVQKELLEKSDVLKQKEGKLNTCYQNNTSEGLAIKNAEEILNRYKADLESHLKSRTTELENLVSEANSAYHTLITSYHDPGMGDGLRDISTLVIDRSRYEAKLTILKEALTYRSAHLTDIINAASEGRGIPALGTYFTKDYSSDVPMRNVLAKLDEISSEAISKIQKMRGDSDALKLRVERFKESKSRCQQQYDEGMTLKNEVETSVRLFNEYKEKNAQLKDEVLNFLKENKVLLTEVKEYEHRQILIQNNVDSENKKRLKLIMDQKHKLENTYGPEFLENYSALTDWIQRTTLDGKESLALLRKLGIDDERYPELKKIREAIADILAIAAKEQQKVSKLSTTNYRTIAVIKIGKLDLRIESVLNEFKRGLDNTVGNILRSIGNIKITMPNVDFVHVKVDLSGINFEHTFNQAVFQLNQTLGQDLLKSLEELDLSKIDFSGIKIGMPKIPELDAFFTQLAQGMGSLFEQLKDIHFEIPSIEFIHIEADIAKDLQNPGNIVTNTMMTVKNGMDHLTKEAEHFLRDLEGAAKKAADDTKGELSKGFKKAGKVLEKVAEPKNLGRMALVYAASVYAGPFGSALANSLLDKLEHPGMSDEDLFKSFAVGAASGYAGESVSGLDIDAIRNLPSASSGIVSNVTKDLGNALAYNKPYTMQDFLTGVATGATSPNFGNGMLDEALNAAADTALDYTLESAIRDQGFDEEKFVDALYNGMANGLTRTAVHDLMDKYVTKYIPRRMDKKVLSELGDILFQVNQQNMERSINKTADNLEHLSLSDQEDLMTGMYEKQVEYIEKYANAMGKSVSELTKEDLSSERFQHGLQFYVASSLNDRTEKIGEIFSQVEEKAEGAQRDPSLAFSTGAVLAAAGVALTIYEIHDLSQRYKESNKSFLEFAKDNAGEIALLSMPLAIGGMRLVGKLGVTGVKNLPGIISTAQKLGIKTKEGMVKLGKAMTSKKINPFELNSTHKITMSKKKFAKFKEQLKHDGMVRDTVKYVEHNGKKYIVDGHHRVRAAKELGMKDVPVEKVQLPFKGYNSIDDLLSGGM